MVARSVVQCLSAVQPCVIVGFLDIPVSGLFTPRLSPHPFHAQCVGNADVHINLGLSSSFSDASSVSHNSYATAAPAI